MAQGIRFICQHCRHTIEAWSDGNPFYLDAHGQKHYAYHPDHERLSLCIGNDSPHLCLTCGTDFMVDSRNPHLTCPKCGSARTADTYHLDGQPCPFCKSGSFAVDPDFYAIS